MEFKVTEVKKTTVDMLDDSKPDKFVSTHEAVSGDQVMKISEINRTDYSKGDIYEYKRISSQQKLVPLKEKPK